MTLASPPLRRVAASSFTRLDFEFWNQRAPLTPLRTASEAPWEVLAKGRNASEPTKLAANDIRITIRRKLGVRNAVCWRSGARLGPGPSSTHHESSFGGWHGRSVLAEVVGL
jgi:hypothetical protein